MRKQCAEPGCKTTPTAKYASTGFCHDHQNKTPAALKEQIAVLQQQLRQAEHNIKNTVDPHHQLRDDILAQPVSERTMSVEQVNDVLDGNSRMPATFTAGDIDAILLSTEGRSHQDIYNAVDAIAASQHLKPHQAGFILQTVGDSEVETAIYSNHDNSGEGGVLTSQDYIDITDKYLGGEVNMRAHYYGSFAGLVKEPFREPPKEQFREPSKEPLREQFVDYCNEGQNPYTLKTTQQVLDLIADKFYVPPEEKKG